MFLCVLFNPTPDDNFATSQACLSIATAFFATGQIIGPVIGGVVVERYGLQFGVVSSVIFMAIAAALAGLHGQQQRKSDSH